MSTKIRCPFLRAAAPQLEVGRGWLRFFSDLSKHMPSPIAVVFGGIAGISQSPRPSGALDLYRLDEVSGISHADLFSNISAEDAETFLRSRADGDNLVVLSDLKDLKAVAAKPFGRSSTVSLGETYFLFLLAGGRRQTEKVEISAVLETIYGRRNLDRWRLSWDDLFWVTRGLFVPVPSARPRVETLCSFQVT